MAFHPVRPTLMVLALFGCTLASASTEITYPKYAKEMKRHDIDVRHITDESVAASYDRLGELLDSKISDLEKKDDKDAGKGKSGKALLLRSVASELDRKSSGPPQERRAAFVEAVRGLYAVEAEPHEDRHLWWHWLYFLYKGPTRFWTRAPRLTPDMLEMTHAEYVRAKKPGHKLEAEGLVDENDVRFSRDGLDDKTLRQIADLDVAADHPAWLQETERARVASTAWERIERRAEELASRSKTFAGARESASARYRLDTARRVLFFDEMKESATSPKLDAQDAFGMTWKVKFGNQAQPEPIASRLFALLGQKFADLVYTNRRGGEDLVLILPKGVEVQRIVREFAEGYYDFDIDPYLDATGVITELRGNRLVGSAAGELAPLPEGSSLGADELVGRPYMTFRESEVEFQGSPDVYARVGPVAKNFAGANDDRGERAGLVASMWINNFDAKDENSRTILIPSGSDGARASDSMEMLEIYHDLGGTLGGQHGDYGLLNKLKIGEDFVGVGRKNLKFKQYMLYRPTSWTKMTAADGLWMARKVASITKSQIEAAVAPSHLPSFMQETYVYRIADRRDQIAHAYGLTPPDHVAPPNADLDLSPSQRAAVAKRLGLDPQVLDHEIEEARQHGFQGDVDHLVIDGRISECQDTVLLGLLESEVYPSGLVRRTKAGKDDHPLPRCRYGVKPKKY